jgi:chromosome segregation ATPase
MSTYVTREEFDGRIRVLEGEVEGEKLVTRYILEQTQRNGDDLAALKARVEHLSSDVAIVRGAITGHTALLNVLVQDVGGLRQEVGQMRRDMGQFRQEVGEMRRDMGQFRQEVGEMRRDMGQFRQEVGEIRRDMGQLREEVRQEIGEMRRDMGTMGADIAAIRVAVAPRGPVGGN